MEELGRNANALRIPYPKTVGELSLSKPPTLTERPTETVANERSQPLLNVDLPTVNQQTQLLQTPIPLLPTTATLTTPQLPTLTQNDHQTQTITPPQLTNSPHLQQPESKSSRSQHQLPTQTPTPAANSSLLLHQPTPPTLRTATPTTNEHNTLNRPEWLLPHSVPPNTRSHSQSSVAVPNTERQRIVPTKLTAEKPALRPIIRTTTINSL